MGAFEYTALTDSGRKSRGTLEADSARAARQQLRAKGLVPLEVAPATETGNGSARLFSGSPGLSIKHLALLTRQIATLLRAGIPLEEALGAIANQTRNQKIRRIVLAVRGKVLEGHSFAQSLSSFPRAFPKLYRATVEAGEHSGHLDAVLERLGDYTENQQKFRQKVQLALIYPAVLVVICILVVTGLMVYVVPDVIEVFTGTGQVLPLPTRILVAFSDFISAWGWLVPPAVAALVVAIAVLLRRPAVRYRFHHKLLELPMIGWLVRGSQSARYVGTLAILTGSSVPLVQAMGIASGVMSNDFLKERLQIAQKNVREGGSLRKALEDVEYFPPMMIYMIASGESSGTLDEMLGRAAESQEQDLQGAVTAFVSLFEPAMLLLMAGIVLFIVMAIMMPIMSMNQLVV
ncbi:type II secretion system inner membrane protein GspF [Microbulbifer thermotolerans]|uniref:Type II secretion system inner membrane protein GspF n=1 Tax=Microbulbifer thermotolerans TaxID=252514 RepID=A0A143HLM6_MICTH|nr:type II secretion system inner membrane protein GspF [Microbulbifer thermotolerans]AMX02593.1 type II secretion system protein GspF [Microbulbifer thermotolerans]MCX2779738.1 type II secretion system inner membrane protein GspF [Microbulbifer thermotolerans]MCX2782330.1 type II secretion system inner membrane protein GspF [Microbulbifer thermotolerans]MCX2794919.1 type II secretion system inner membrane protein GspF [Microbulbifer thermotolerans]MCX2800483.1 type II secretion system inner m